MSDATEETRLFSRKILGKGMVYKRRNDSDIRAPTRGVETVDAAQTPIVRQYTFVLNTERIGYIYCEEIFFSVVHDVIASVSVSMKESQDYYETYYASFSVNNFFYRKINFFFR